MRPLERLTSIRAKLGSVIVFAVAITLLLVFFFLAYALRNSPRDSEVLLLLDTAKRFSNGRLDTIPVGTMIVYEPTVGVVEKRGVDLGVEPPRFDDNDAHWGITEGIEYVAIPRVEEGAVVGTDYAMRRAPDQGFSGRVESTVIFLKGKWAQLLLAGAIAALIALLLSRWMARGMTKPLRDMAKAARGMAMGDYSQRVETPSRDEVGQLAAAFNRMSSELSGVEGLRRQLVADVSHELKTPISALRAHLENVLDGVEEPDRETLQVMLHQSERLGALVDQLMELSRLESGDLPLDRSEVSLRPLVQRVLDEVEVARPAGEVQVDNRVPGDLVPVLVDEGRVHQVLFNLLDNAVRFSPSGGEVTVSASRSNGHVEVRVADAGPGISSEHLPHVFERFYRVDPARARTGGGTGIGLAIAKSVVEAHGGHIRAESEEGRGAVFVFDLPVADGRSR